MECKKVWSTAEWRLKYANANSVPKYSKQVYLQNTVKTSLNKNDKFMAYKIMAYTKLNYFNYHNSVTTQM